jgi:hypothetical protein
MRSPWPPSSPDLTLLDFYFGGSLKGVRDSDDIINRTEVTATDIRNLP